MSGPLLGVMLLCPQLVDSVCSPIHCSFQLFQWASLLLLSEKHVLSHHDLDRGLLSYSVVITPNLLSSFPKNLKTSKGVALKGSRFSSSVNVLERVDASDLHN